MLLAAYKVKLAGLVEVSTVAATDHQPPSKKGK
jgi:hypothetical protein